jgi:hypothetical protein
MAIRIIVGRGRGVERGLFQFGFIVAGLGRPVLPRPIAAFVTAGNREGEKHNEEHGREGAHAGVLQEKISKFRKSTARRP